MINISEQKLNIEKNIKGLPENLFEFVNPENPIEKRLMAAEGAIPLTPKDLARVLFCLVSDSEKSIREAAKISLIDIPEQTMIDILADNTTSAGFLDYIAENFKNEGYIQSVLLNPATDDSTYAFLAQHEHSQVNIEIIAQNKQRILRSIDIVEGLSKNPSISRSTLDSVLSFISLYLEKDESIKKFFDEDQKEDGRVEEFDDMQEQDEDIEDIKESFFDDLETPEELLKEYKEEELTDAVRDNLLSKIRTLTIAQKIKLSIQGNMETRRILIRDGNRLISSAVLKNSRLSDMEIILIAGSKVVNEDVLRQISETRKWTRHYQVKSALVHNPKTPVHISMNLLRHLRHVELKLIMLDKNLPGVINQAAKRITMEKK